MRRAHRALLCLAAATTLAGCGTTSSATNFEGEQEAVAEVVEEIQAAGERKNPGKICDDLLARALAQRIAAAGSTCEAEMDKTIDDVDDFALEVTDVTVTGTTARATVRGRSRDEAMQTAIFTFAKQGGQWRATALATR
jgi:hypothetical protein